MKLKDKKILVTGGAGFIGSNLVDALAKNNDVLVVDDFSVGTEERLSTALETGRVKIAKVDIESLEAIDKLVEGIDIVYHLAARGVRISLSDPFAVHDVNATGSLNLYAAAYKHNVKKFIHVSSSEVYGTAHSAPMNEDHPLNPETVYGASKLAGELYGMAYFRTNKMPVAVIRPFNTYGPRSHFKGPYGEVIPRFVIRAMNDLPLIIFGDGSQTRDFTFVEDTVKGMMLVGEEDKAIGEIVNIAFGMERTIKEVAEVVLRILKKEDLGVQYQEGRPGDVMRHYADITKAKKLLGFSPSIGLEEGIERYIRWISAQGIDFKEALKDVTDRNW